MGVNPVLLGGCGTGARAVLQSLKGRDLIHSSCSGDVKVPLWMVSGLIEPLARCEEVAATFVRVWVAE